MIAVATCCPTCGQALRETLDVLALADIPMSPTERLILKAMVAAFPRNISAEGMAEAIYAHRRDGGPGDPRANLAVYRSRLRAKLKPYGWTMKVGSPGLAGGHVYQLEKLP